MNVKDMNARKQDKFVKKVYWYDTPASSFAFRKVLQFMFAGVLLAGVWEFTGLGSLLFMRAQQLEDKLRLRQLEESALLITYRHVRDVNKEKLNTILTWLGRKEPSA